jgi:hypothetical protein
MGNGLAPKEPPTDSHNVAAAGGVAGGAAAGAAAGAIVGRPRRLSYTLWPAGLAGAPPQGPT